MHKKPNFTSLFFILYAILICVSFHCYTMDPASQTGLKVIMRLVAMAKKNPDLLQQEKVYSTFLKMPDTFLRQIILNGILPNLLDAIVQHATHERFAAFIDDAPQDLIQNPVVQPRIIQNL